MTILTTESVDARQLVDRLIADALQRRASDIHVDPTATACEVKFRIDGLLEAAATHPPDVGRMLVTRLMVMAKLLTYRLDVPQEGRAEFSPTGLNGSKPIELRVSIMPTTHGPRAAVRLPAELLQPQTLEQLMLPPDVLDGLKAFASADSSMLVVTGPAGSGKTTTIYALLRHIAQVNAGLSIVTLEDPVERDLPGSSRSRSPPSASSRMSAPCAASSARTLKSSCSAKSATPRPPRLRSRQHCPVTV